MVFISQITSLFITAPFLAFNSIVLFAQPYIKFEERTKKFEKVKAGEILHFEYVFINAGNRPLLLNDVKAGCGCTVPEFPRKPVQPDGKDTIRVSFDTKGKIGYQDRELEVISNAKNSTEKIRFKGVVDNNKSGSR